MRTCRITIIGLIVAICSMIVSPAIADPHMRDGRTTDCFHMYRVVVTTITSDYYGWGMVGGRKVTSTDTCLTGGYTYKWNDYERNR